jgi:hypothetical protein
MSLKLSREESILYPENQAKEKKLQISILETKLIIAI